MTTPLEGVVYNDPIPGDRFGFSVATAGDFNGDGADDIIIGAPGSTDRPPAAGYRRRHLRASTGHGPRTTATRINGDLHDQHRRRPPHPAAPRLHRRAIGSFAGFSVAPSAATSSSATTTGHEPASADILHRRRPGSIAPGAAYLDPRAIPRP